MIIDLLPLGDWTKQAISTQCVPYILLVKLLMSLVLTYEVAVVVVVLAVLAEVIVVFVVGYNIIQIGVETGLLQLNARFYSVCGLIKKLPTDVIVSDFAYVSRSSHFIHIFFSDYRHRDIPFVSFCSR